MFHRNLSLTEFILKKIVFRINSLYGKIAISVIVILTLFFSILVFWAKKTGTDLLDQLMLAKTHSVLDLVENAISKTMMEGRYHGIQNLVSGMISSMSVEEISILDDDGKIIIDGKNLAVGKKVEVHDFILTNNRHDTKYKVIVQDGVYLYKAIHPIFKRQECRSCHQSNNSTVGSLMMTISMKDIQENSSKHQKSNFVLVVVTLLSTGFSLFIMLSLWVIIPIKKLSKEMQRVSCTIHHIGKEEKSFLEIRKVVNSDDEIGDLQKQLAGLIDELNSAYKEIKEIHANRMMRADQLAVVGEMAASIAHEIRNPVAGVQGALEIIKSEIEHDQPKKEIIEEMQIQLKRVNKAVTDLLSYARPSVPHCILSDVTSLIRRTASLLTRQIQEKKIDLKILNVTEIPDLYIDEKLIQQVFFNIILNAIDAVKECGRIQIALSKFDGSVLMKFSDDGDGIPEDIKENIFKPFYTTKHKGTGLGLAISKKILEQHNGSITLDSTMNRGTTMLIKLPINQG